MIPPVTRPSSISNQPSKTTKANCPTNCGRRFITEAHAIAHADKEHPDWRIPRSKGWRTPYGFVDLKEPMTYEEACEISKTIHEALMEKIR